MTKKRIAEWFGVPVSNASCYDDLPTEEVMAVNVLLAVEAELSRPKEERSLRNVMRALGFEDEPSGSETEPEGPAFAGT